jgi:glutamate/tyrosine decarboxylase-like PLP-dependent enzyme
MDVSAVLDKLQCDVFTSFIHVNHPRFFAFVPGPGNFVGAMGDALASGLNPFAGTWLAGSGFLELELVTVDWLRQICGLPAGAGGLFVSGGSMANLTGLVVARHLKLGDRVDGAVVYSSDQTHHSVERALRVIGFLPDQLRKIKSDEKFRLPLSDLKEAVRADLAAGRTPFCVIANAGTTNTGAVDPLPELLDFCGKHGLWLHADAAYGGPAVLTEKGRHALRGLEAVDSLSLDPHKWLFQPFEIGCVLVRDFRWLKDTFRLLPEYLQDAHALEEVNLCDYGVQLTRYPRALKLWMSLKVFGLEAFREAVAWGIELAELAEERLWKSPCLQVVTPAQLGIVTFRHVDDAVNRALVDKLFADGFAFLSSTTLRGRTVLRMCTINPRTTQEDVVETIGRVEELAGQA